MTQGTQTRAPWQPRGVGWGRRWEGGSGGKGHVCACLFVFGGAESVAAWALLWLWWAGSTPAVACRFLIAVASPAAERGLRGPRPSVVVVPGLSSYGSRPLEHRLGSCGTRLIALRHAGILPDQGLNPCLLYWQADSLQQSRQGNPIFF